MIEWLTHNQKLGFLLSLVFSVLGVWLFFLISKITYDLHILIPLFAIVSCVFYLFGYAAPFIGGAIIELNRSLLGIQTFKAVSLTNFLLWFAIICLPINAMMMLAGAGIIGVGISSNLGIIMGCIHYLARSEKQSEQDVALDG